MRINYSRRFLIREETVKRCHACNQIFTEDHNFCPKCGSKLSLEKTKVYANMGKHGTTISSYSYILPDGTTINSKGNITIPVANHLSVTFPKK